MAIVASNGLTGPDGVQPTAGSLADTGTAPVFLDNAGMLYSDDVQIRVRNSVLLRTNLTRTTASRFSWTKPSGAWTMRFYLRTPPLSEPFDIAERRLLIEFGTEGMMFRESAARNVVSRLQPLTLAASNVVGAESGQARAFDQLLRYEIMFDGVDELIVRIFAGNDTTPWRQNVWEYTPDGNTITISGYRWYNYPVLQSGDTDATTGGQVTVLQNQLLVWDPNSLPQFGADGDYGGETTAAVFAFQDAMGIAQTGAAGPETRTALALYERLDNDPGDYPDPIWVGNMAITNTAEWIGPLDLSSTSLNAEIEFVSQVEAEETTISPEALVEVSAEVSTFASRTTEADAEVGFGSDAAVTKRADLDVSDGQVGFGATLHIQGQSLIPDPPQLPAQFELLVYNSFGSIRGTLNHALNWSASVPHNGVGTMSLTVSAHSPDDQLLTPPFEIALRLRPSNAENFVEPPGCRFISLRRQRDLADRSGTYTWTLGNFGWILRKAKVEMALGTPFSVTERTFTNSSVGAMFDAMMFNTQIGPVFGISRSFSNTTDSNGDPWTDSQTIDLTYGASFQSLLEQWSDQRLVDWRFQGRNWQMYRADDGMMRNRTSLKPLSPNQGVLEATEVFSYEDFANRVLFVRPGQQGVQRTARGAASVPVTGPWGTWNETLSLPGVTTNGAAAAMAQDALAKLSDLRPQTTYRFPVLDNNYVPLYHFVTGDVIFVEDPAQPDDGTDFSPPVLPKQVHQITLSSNDGRYVEALVTTENRLLNRDVKSARYYKAQASGSDSVWGNRAVIPFWQT